MPQKLRKYYSSSRVLWITVIVLLGYACQSNTNTNPAATPSPLSRYHKVTIKYKSLPQSLRSSGRLILQKEIYLSFKIGGNITQLNAQKGDRIQQGQLMASLDKNQLLEQISQAQTQYQRIKADLERLQTLYKEQNIGKLQEIEQLQTNLELAKSNLQIAQNNLKETQLYAPNSGIVLDKFQEMGETTSPGKPLFLISGAGENYVFEVSLTDLQVVQVKLNDAAEIYFSAYPQQPLKGNISRVSLAPNPATGLYEAEITFTNDALRLKPGFIGEAVIYTGTSQSMAFLPPEALIETNKNEAQVYVLDKNKKLTTRKVKIAKILDNEIAISEGLEGIEEVYVP